MRIRGHIPFSKTSRVLSGVFNPDELDSQFAWTFDDAGDRTVSGSDLQIWNEIYGSGWDFNHGSSYPTFFASGGPNNLPYVQIPSGRILRQIPGPVSSSPFELWMVVRTPVITETGVIGRVGLTGGGNGFRYYSATRVSEFYSGISPFYIGNTRGSVPRTTWMLLRVSMTDQDSGFINVNDEPVTFNMVDNEASTSAYPLSQLNFGNHPNLELAEARMFSRSLTDEEATNLKSYLLTKFNIGRPAKHLITYGDSHTVGVTSGTTSGQPYMKTFCENTNIIVSQKENVGACADNNNTNYDFPDIAADCALEKWNDAYVLFNYGTNDCATANGGYGWTSWDNWEASYKANIQLYIDAGFSLSKLMIATPPYSTAAYVNGNLTEVRTRIENIATDLGIVLLDWSQECIDLGLDCATVAGGDTIHGDNAIHAPMYDLLVAQTGTS